MMRAARLSVWTRFWSKVTVDPVTGCWLWTGAIGHRRRSGVDGRLRGDGPRQSLVSPHRQVTHWAYGPPPSLTHHAAHSCDVDLCCNPAHLRWATQAENEEDKYFVVCDDLSDAPF